VENAESPEAALDYLFPVGPMSEDQLAAEFDRVNVRKYPAEIMNRVRLGVAQVRAGRNDAARTAPDARRSTACRNNGARAVVGFQPKVAILNGKPRARSTGSLFYSTGRRYDSTTKRYLGLMCQACLHGDHATCKTKDCPCPCNDSEVSFQRNRLTAIGALPIGTATVCPTVAQS
jgi:hypothetical protein